MKRLVTVLSICLITVLMSASVCFAGSLEVVNSSPKDGETGMAIDNMGVKLYFNQDMYSKKYNKANEKCFKIVDDKGSEVPTIVVFNNKEGYRDQVLVLCDTTADYKVKEEMEYTLVIDENLVSANGDSLSVNGLKENTISFTTINRTQANMINMLMMVVMMVVMIVITMRGARKKEEEKKKDDKVNPYKEAKKTGKSVEEIVAKDEKNKAKKAAKEEKKAASEAKEKEKAEAKRKEAEEKALAARRKRVAGPRPVSAAGSTYVSGRKAAAEAKAAEEAARRAQGTTNPKNKGKKKK